MAWFAGIVLSHVSLSSVAVLYRSLVDNPLGDAFRPPDLDPFSTSYP